MNTKLLLSGVAAAAVIAAVAHIASDESPFKGVQAATPSAAPHVLDHSKVDWSRVPVEPNPSSRSIAANDD
jgi:hypothetical protein